MALSGFHLNVAKVLGRTTGDKGFALGGGYGLQMHDVTDRPSKDLDSYVNRFETTPFEDAERDLIEALRAEGYTANVTQRNDVLRVIEVRDPATGEDVVVDLAYDYRRNPPVQMGEVGPVLDLEDLALGKVRAFIDRQAERDYADLDRFLASGRWSPQDLYQTAQSVRPEVSKSEFAAMLAESDLGDPTEYEALGLSEQETGQMHKRLSEAAREIESGRTQDQQNPLHMQQMNPGLGGSPGAGGIDGPSLG